MLHIGGKLGVMLHIGAAPSNNHQIILKLFGYDIFCNILQHIGAAPSNNHQIILKLFGYDIFCNILQHKKI